MDMTIIKRRTRARRTAIATAACAVLAMGLLAGGPAPASAAEASSSAPAVRAKSSIPFTRASVAQLPDGSFTVDWRASSARRVTVYAGHDQDSIDLTRPVAEGDGSARVTVSGLGQADRWWFRLVPDRGLPLTLADRSLHLEGASNTRDAGGYRTADGHWVRMGVLYRSNDLSLLTEADRAKLSRLGVRTIVDLRAEDERAQNPDRVPEGAETVAADVLGEGLPPLPSPLTEANAVQWLMDAERFLVSGEAGKAGYGIALSRVGEPGTLIHCTVGKDRTGWASAALLAALGVPRETVMADYLKSNEYLAAENEAVLEGVPADLQPAYRALLDVRPEYLNAGFDEAEQRFGSFRGYLKDALGVDDNRLKELRERLLVG